jgi:hypothetical protein
MALWQTDPGGPAGTSDVWWRFVGKQSRLRQEKKRQGQKPAPAPVSVVKSVDEEELKALIDRARSGALSEEECSELRAVVETLAFVTRELDTKNLTLKRLRALFGLATSEKLDHVLPPGGRPSSEGGAQQEASAAEGGAQQDAPPSEGSAPQQASGASSGSEGAGQGPPSTAEKEGEPAPGHGRNGADSYGGAERVEVCHDCLRAGASCPSCKVGTLYEQKHRPKTLVRVEGQAPLKATIYELQTFRCGLCGELFSAEPPAGVGDTKYDASAAAMIGLLRYGCGMPFHRLERLEGNLGVPLPASTQWDVVSEAVEGLVPAYEELVRVAAHGEVLHTDDTAGRVLSLMKENAALHESGAAADGARTGIFVTGLVSLGSGCRVGLFFTGRKHAGENLEDVLAERTSELGPPLHMSDGLDRNDPKTAATETCRCLVHGRRNFVEIVESFPVECKYVLETIAEVYKHDDECRERGLSPEARLVYHVERSKPPLDDLKRWFERQFAERLVEPNSSLGGAINYMLKRWEELTLFLRKAGAPLDNNVCERLLKKAIQHRKNSLFYKTLNGARVGDVYMSLIYTTEINGGNPFEYLTALLRNVSAVAADPAARLPWTYLERLAAAEEPSAG